MYHYFNVEMVFNWIFSQKAAGIHPTTRRTTTMIVLQLNHKNCTVVQIHKLNNTIDTARKSNIQDASSSTTILDSTVIISKEWGFKLKTLTNV